MSRPTTTEEFVRKAKKIHESRYDYSQVKYVKSKIKVSIVCWKNGHGLFRQTPSDHLYSKGCPKCAGNIRSSTEEFIQKARKKHGGRYDYSQVRYVGVKTNVSIICRKNGHGSFQQRPNGHLGGAGCPECWEERRGQSLRLSHEEFIERAKERHGSRYDYSKVAYVGGNILVTIVCSVHGDFQQRPNDHSKGHGCDKCGGGAKSSTEEFINKSKAKHGDRYNYSKIVYIDSRTPVLIDCRKHGQFQQTPHEHLSGCGCFRCKQSRGEQRIAERLENLGIPYERQKRFQGCQHILFLPFDFYLPTLEALIEYHGRQHYVSVPFWGGKRSLRDTRKRDLIKRRWARQNGYALVVIPDRIVDVEGCLQMRLSKLRRKSNGIQNSQEQRCA
jgi:hypothetical protein